MTPLRGGSTGRSAWLIITLGPAVVGLAAALLLINWATLLIVFTVVVGVVGPLHLNIAMVTEDLSLGLLRLVISWAARAGALVLVLCGYAEAIGLATLPLLGILGFTAWSVFGLPKGRVAGETSPSNTVDLRTLGDPAKLDEEGLCLAWRRSSAVLKGCRRPEERQALAELRRRCLDELERRRPEAFAEWLKAGPQAAAGDPAEYFSRHRGRRNAAD